MKVKDNDGHIFEADTAEELVSQLRLRSFAPALSDEAYMEQAAKRAILQKGGGIRSGTAHEFIHDLLRYGLLVEVKPPPSMDF
jgi:hypothetical protein